MSGLWETLGRVRSQLGGLWDRRARVLEPCDPVIVRGPWSRGLALAMHSEPGGQPEGSDIGVGPALARFKYGGDRRLGPLLARRLAKAVLDDPTFDGVDVITHVPSARRAAYEPACELAFFAAKCLRKRLLPHLVVRRRTLVPQKDIFGIDDKRRNVAGAFRVCRPDLVHGRKVLLLDDVFDSGATLAEVTRELRAAGAAQVFVATVTKTRYLQGEE